MHIIRILQFRSIHDLLESALFQIFAKKQKKYLTIAKNSSDKLHGINFMHPKRIEEIAKIKEVGTITRFQ